MGRLAGSLFEEDIVLQDRGRGDTLATMAAISRTAADMRSSCSSCS